MVRENVPNFYKKLNIFSELLNTMLRELVQEFKGLKLHFDFVNGGETPTTCTSKGK